MNLQHLEYLIEIENCGSISKAARRLFVTQPYLSRILKEVESEYGITVFTREKTGITPAARSKSFCPSATWRSIFSSPPGPSSSAGRTTRS